MPFPISERWVDNSDGSKRGPPDAAAVICAPTPMLIGFGSLLTGPTVGWFNATVEAFPVMLPEDLEKAGPSIAAAVKKWGTTA